MKFLNIFTANKQVDTLEAQVADLTKQLEQLTKEAATVKEREAALVLATQDWAAEKELLIKGHEDAIKALMETNTKQTQDLEKTAKEADKTSGAKAAEIVASLGVEPEAVKLTKEDLVGKEKPYQRFTVTVK